MSKLRSPIVYFPNYNHNSTSRFLTIAAERLEAINYAKQH